jgi:hypothetical protein
MIIDQDFLSANLQPFIVSFEAEDRNIQIVFHRRGRALLPQLRAKLNDLQLHSYKVMVPGRNYLAKRVYAAVNAPQTAISLGGMRLWYRTQIYSLTEAGLC